MVKFFEIDWPSDLARLVDKKGRTACLLRDCKDIFIFCGEGIRPHHRFGLEKLKFSRKSDMTPVTVNITGQTYYEVANLLPFFEKFYRRHVYMMDLPAPDSCCITLPMLHFESTRETNEPGYLDDDTDEDDDEDSWGYGYRGGNVDYLEFVRDKLTRAIKYVSTMDLSPEKQVFDILSDKIYKKALGDGKNIAELIMKHTEVSCISDKEKRYLFGVFGWRLNESESTIRRHLKQIQGMAPHW